MQVVFFFIIYEVGREGWYLVIIYCRDFYFLSFLIIGSKWVCVRDVLKGDFDCLKLLWKYWFDCCLDK